MHPAAGQPPQQIAIHRAEHQFASIGARARAGHVIEDPGYFGSGKIRIDDQAGFGGNRRLVAFGLQARADIRGAAILPDDGAVNSLAGGAVPHDSSFALVGDADSGDVARGDIGFSQGFATGGEGGGPDILRLMLDPARGRKMLREFSLRGGCDGNVGAKQNRARGCGALIDGQHKGHDVNSRKVCLFLRWRAGKRIEGRRSIWIACPGCCAASFALRC